tara:strand:+ start:873 stop:1802 length:930 start_codon:yes stop_codon:yes gene_type:complete
MNTWQREALYHAKTEYPKESCGLVIEKDGNQEYYPCNNIEIDGVNSFTIDPEDWAKAEDIGTILHICHSHPNGDLRASELDIKNCNNIGLSWFIFAPVSENFIELKPKEYKPLLSRDKFIDTHSDDKELRKIKVYGRLAEKLGWHTAYAKIDNLNDVYGFLTSNYPHVKAYLKQNIYRVKVSDNVIFNDEIPVKLGKGDLVIIPVVSGRIFQLILGPILLGFGLAAKSKVLATFLVTLGTGLTLDGVERLLFPPKKPNFAEEEVSNNFSFNGLQNVSRPGVAVPLVYGECLVGSVVISAGVDTAQVRDS